MAHSHDVIDDDLYFTIDPSTREINNESQKVKLMQYDHNSEQFTFELPRFVEGHDMSLCNSIRVNYINIHRLTREQGPGVYEVSDIQVREDNIIFSWLISRNATQYAGPLNFLIKFMCFDEDGNVIYEWHTDIFKNVSVSTGINNEETIEEVYPDILEKWKNDVLSNITPHTVKRIESLDSNNMVNLRDLESGSYVLHGAFKPYSGSDATLTFGSNLVVNILRGSDNSQIQVLYPDNNCVQYLNITDASYERKDVYLNDLASISDAVLFNTSQTLTEDQKTQARSNISAVSSDEFNQVNGNKVDKDEILNAGIRNISYVPLFGGSFTVTTVEEEGYIKPHAIATVTGRISKHYTYRVTINEEEYVLPCCLFSTRDSSGKVFEYLGNIELYTSDISGLMQDAIHNVPFCIISDLHDTNSIDVFTQSSCEVSITVERMQKEQTPLPKSLIWGDDYCPIELKKNENSVFNGISIGSNILKNSRGTFAIGYGNKISGEFGIAIGCGNTSSGTASYVEGFDNTSSGMYSHAEGFRTTASGDISHAEGFNTTASGATSHAEGFGTTASGDKSHAEGSSSNAIGPCSHAEGQATKANGAMSHSGGNNSIADGRASFAHGNFSKATQPAQFAVGYGNDPQEDSIFEVGNGLNADGAPNNTGNTEPVTRQNAFRVTQSGVAIAQTGLQIGNTVISEDQLKKIIASGSVKSVNNIKPDENGNVTITDLPAVTSEDSGKFLRVSSTGEWVAESISNAEEARF